MAGPFHRLLRSTLVTSSSRLIGINPQRQSLFSLQWRRNYASERKQPAYKEHLLRLLAYEIRYEQDHSPPMIPPSRYYVYSIDDRPEEQWICLRTKFVDDEDVKIEVTMVDKEVTIPGTKNGGPLDEIDPHISCVVNISKGGGGDVLEITCSAWPDAIEITKLFVRRDGALPANIYDGPEIIDLDRRLLYAVYDILEARGIDNEFAVFLHEYMENKRKAEYIRWMGRIKSHVEQQ